ncbi:Hypothetical predicted protein [Paramuricea clavata]|uniref:Uncharacterized protein n=1 Tax=Paramuricea clavata TaxID=317549 RepID=A0A6S7H1X4_PARCT|nr:Hypothetical predicted protein [Paramuricea clavata]
MESKPTEPNPPLETHLISTITAQNKFSAFDNEIPDIPNSPMQTTQEKDSLTEIKADTVILCDSNGRNINPTLLCPNTTTIYPKRPTVEHAREILDRNKFIEPKTFIIHCGTNDIEKLPTDNISKQMKSLLSSINQKHPQSRIILSSPTTTTSFKKPETSMKN